MKIQMSSAKVINFYKKFDNLGIKIWIDGGWSVDSLLEKQIYPHKDLDIAMEWKDVPKFRELLETEGYKQIKEDSKWNFVLGDNSGHEIDVHAFVYDDKGNVVDGIMYPAASLTGTGTINRHTVRCIAPKYMVEFLAPWISKWPEKYFDAVFALCQKFGIALPDEYSKFKKQT